ncbi:MAG: hypothetical protein R6T98_04870 [Desulfatiglandales bacterium]
MEGCCLFVTYQWGNPQAPIYRGNAEGAKLPHGYVAEKTNPGALELKKSPSSLDQEGLCKGLMASFMAGWLAYDRFIKKFLSMLQYCFSDFSENQGKLLISTSFQNDPAIPSL